MYCEQGEDYYMGCLADIRCEFMEGNSSYFDIDMSSYINYPVMGQAIREAARLFPDYNNREPSCTVRIRDDDSVSYAHCLLGPYRIFAELEGPLEFFNENKEHGTMGAFIACHTACLDDLATMIQGKTIYLPVEGWHQSMFCGFEISNLGDSFSIRRIAAMYPQFRELLNSEHSIQYTYTIGTLRADVERRVRTALRKTFGLPNSIGELDYNTESKEITKLCQLWHDTIFIALKKEIT